MKEKNYSPYATNQAGKIESPKKKSNKEPSATKTQGNDLRTKRG